MNAYTQTERYAVRTDLAMSWLAWAQKYRYDERKALYGCQQAERILNARDQNLPLAGETV